MTAAPLCASCRYWHSADGAAGECRRHAPRPAPAWPGGNAPGFSAWPATGGGEWCGDHVAAPPPAPRSRPQPSPLREPERDA